MTLMLQGSMAAEGAAASATPVSASIPALGLGSLLLIAVSVTLIWLRRKPVMPAGPKVVKVEPIEVALPQEDDHRKRLAVFFGTQTGTAEGFAKAVAEEARARYGDAVAVDVIDLDEYGADDEAYAEKLPQEAHALFFLATYGDGEPTDNAARFMKWITELAEGEEDKSRDFLAKVQYTIFGLGNRQYENFNSVAKHLDKVMASLGALQVLKTGLGDDDACIEDDFASWKEGLWPALDPLLSSSDADLSSPLTPYHAGIPEYSLKVHPDGEAVLVAESHPETVPGAGHDIHKPVRALVALQRELYSADSERSCVHLEFAVPGKALPYEAGDHVGVFVENSDETVAEAARLLGVGLDTVFSLESDAGHHASLPEPFPCPISLHTALARYTDLLSSPKKAALLALAEQATKPEEAQRLRHLAGPQGKDEYAEWVVASQRSLLEVLAAFPSARPPLGVFFAAVAPRLQPRYYSISSSPALHPEHIHVTCAVVQEPTPTGRIHHGVASSWMKRAIPSPVLPGPGHASWAPIFVRTSSFKLPSDPLVPIVMVGPGTGLAPFRGFLQERQAKLERGEKLGPAVLFYGCRNRSKDYLYKEELQAFADSGALSELHVAVSREGPTKVYVQHLMQQQASSIWTLLASSKNGGKNGFLYVCGDAKHMAKDVHRVLHQIVQQQECVGGTQAEELVKQLQSEGRYHRDVW